MKNGIEKYVEEIANIIMAAQLNYEIWWIYKEQNNRNRFVDTLNVYHIFFFNSIHAHFGAMIIALYKLFETRKDTVNIPKLIDLIENEESISAIEIIRFKDEINKIKPSWKKICIIRNNLFAHKTDNFDQDDIFKIANVAPNEFKEIIDKSINLINGITYILDEPIYVFNISASQDTIRLLNDLKQLNEKNS